jgi:hypothetical protein
MSANSAGHGGLSGGKFPYERVLAHLRGEVADSQACAAIEERLGDDHHPDHRRYLAHVDSVRYLELERVAALQDGEDLKRFSEEDVTEFCRALAVRGEEILADLVAGRARAGDWSRQQWAEHVDCCVYCRRRRRQAHAHAERQKAGLPEDEPLLRDWLLSCYYEEELAQVTELAAAEPVWAAADAPAGEGGLTAEEGLTPSLKRQPERFLKKMEPVVPLMLEWVLDSPGRAREHEGSFREYLAEKEVLKQLGMAEHVRDALGGVVADYCRKHNLPEGQQARASLTRNVMDNILWQAATQHVEIAQEESNRTSLESVRQALRQQLKNSGPHSVETTVELALMDSCPDTSSRIRLQKRLQQQFEAMSR